jgi:hypothetical protein
VNGTESRQVSWWETHVFINAMVSNFGHLPIAGTPSWCSLADGDPRKLLALAVEGEHHVLRKETAQEHQADIAQGISAAGADAGDWAALGRIVMNGSPGRIPRQVAS